MSESNTEPDTRFTPPQIKKDGDGKPSIWFRDVQPVMNMISALFVIAVLLLFFERELSLISSAAIQEKQPTPIDLADWDRLYHGQHWVTVTGIVGREIQGVDHWFQGRNIEGSKYYLMRPREGPAVFHVVVSRPLDEETGRSMTFDGKETIRTITGMLHSVQIPAAPGAMVLEEGKQPEMGTEFLGLLERFA